MQLMVVVHKFLTPIIFIPLTKLTSSISEKAEFHPVQLQGHKW